jgi:hypothetical protein
VKLSLFWACTKGIGIIEVESIKAAAIRTMMATVVTVVISLKIKRKKLV